MASPRPASSHCQLAKVSSPPSLALDGVGLVPPQPAASNATTLTTAVIRKRIKLTGLSSLFPK